MEEDGLDVNTTGVPMGTQIGTESALTTYAGPYVTDMLGKEQRLLILLTTLIQGL